MDLFERIERTRFLGREFLVWVWWKSDLVEGRMELGEAGPCEVWIDDQMILEARGEVVEQTRLRGAAPGASAEAKEALRSGKVPTKARLSITRDEQEYSFVFDGESFALSGVRLPALLQDEREERFYERMYLCEELEEMLAALFREFLALRTSPLWEARVAPAIRGWVRDEPELEAEEYGELLAEVALPKPKRKAPAGRGAASRAKTGAPRPAERAG
jgi:hypothetical protein